VDPASVLWITFIALLTVATSVWIVGVVDCAYRRYPTVLEKCAWLLVVILGYWLGVIVYWFVGRQRGTLGPV